MLAHACHVVPVEARSQPYEFTLPTLTGFWVSLKAPTLPDPVLGSKQGAVWQALLAPFPVAFVCLASHPQARLPGCVNSVLVWRPLGTVRVAVGMPSGADGRGFPHHRWPRAFPTVDTFCACLITLPSWYCFACLAALPPPPRPGFPMCPVRQHLLLMDWPCVFVILPCLS